MNIYEKVFELINHTPKDQYNEKVQEIITDVLQLKIPVRIYENDEIGEIRWAVAIPECDFWINSFLSKEEAIRYCERKGLPIFCNTAHITKK